MKITDKIVTSKIAPKQLNVVWHNPDTGELKMFNDGWKLVGGNPGEGGSSFSGGYPVVTVENDFNIEALPSIFYNIKNEADSLVNISFKDEEFGGNSGKILLFYTDMERALNLDEYQLFAIQILSLGILVTPNSEYEGFKYKATVSNPTILLSMPELEDCQFFISDIPTDNLQDETSSIDLLAIADVIGEPMTVTLPYIYTINKDIDYIAWYNIDNVIEGGTLPIVFTQEIGYDGTKYKYEGFMCIESMVPCTLYTQVEYTKADKVTIERSGLQQEFIMTVQSNKELTMPDEIKEFVFNLKSPANIVLSHPVSWNNDNTPDFTKSGTYTLSILNGVGCYTFVNK